MREESRLAQHGKRALFREVFSHAAGFVAWSHWAKRSFVEDYGCREQDVAVIPPGVDLEQFSSGDRQHELPRILFVGGDFARKGGRLLLDVFRRRLRGRAELIIVTREAGVADEPGVRVHRNLEANSKELRQLYSSSDIFALPTRADCYSLVIMEALASGLPIVATRVGGIPDLIREGETGHLIDVDDGQALGDRLEALMTDTSRRQAMSQTSRASAVSDFDCRARARQLFEFVSSRC
jgi:glycosyltransferase involved in cell wall biosynthesis